MLNKNAISVFLALCLLLSVITPTIAMLLGHDEDLISMVELNELESNEKEPTTDKENKIIDRLGSNLNLLDLKSFLLEEYYCKNYATPYLNIVSPPPEYSLT